MHLRRAFVALCFLIAAAPGCSTDERPDAEDPSVRIATTLHPFATILRPVVGAAGSVTTLLPAGSSPHTYEPRPSDVRRISRSGMLVFGHPHLDGWAADLTSTTRLELFALLPDSLQHSFPAGIVPEQQQIRGRDPHFWTDPLAVRAILPALTEHLCRRFADHCETFETNAARFSDSLTAIDREIRKKLDPVRGTPVLLATPFFQYFLRQYDFKLLGVIEPLPGSDLPPRILSRTIEAVRAQKAEAILALPQLPVPSAETVSRSAGIPLYRLDPIGDQRQAKTYRDLVTAHSEMLYKTFHNQ